MSLLSLERGRGEFPSLDYIKAWIRLVIELWGEVRHCGSGKSASATDFDSGDGECRPVSHDTNSAGI